MTFRRILFVALAASATVAIGCGDEGGDGNTDTDTGADTGNPDISIGDTDSGGNTCESEVACERSTDCRNAGLDNYICGDDGCCIEDETTTLPECARHLAECESDEQTNDNFICDTTAGQCIQRCNVANTDATRGDTCPTNSYCFDAGLTEPPVSSEGETLDGACIPGDCDSTIFDPAACADSETAADGTCLPVGNGASFCITAGTAAVGEPCGQSTDEEPPPSDSCEAGLMCFRGECITPCDLTDDTSCGDGTECLEVFDTTTTNQPGACAVGCSEFSEGECGDGSSCTPAWGRFGVNEWICSEVPGTVVGPGEECDADLGNFANCPEGYLCIQEVEDGPSTCERICDPLGEAEGDLASCGASAAGAQVIPPTAFGETSDYLVLPAGSYPVDLRLADGTFVAPALAQVVDGELHSIVATADADGELDLIDLVDLAPGDTLPAQGIRALHAAATAGEVDAYLGTVVASGVELGDITNFGTAEPGDYNVIAQLAGGTEALATTAEIVAGENFLFVAHETADGEGLAATALSWPIGGDALGGNTALRVLHAVPGAGNVDIYVNCGMVGEACAAADPLIADLAFGSSETVEVAGGNYDLWIYAAGATPGMSDELATIAVTLDAGTYATAIAHHDGGDFALAFSATADITPAVGSAYVAFAHVADGAPAVDAILEGQTSIGSADYGDTLEGDASSYIGLEEGTYAVSIRAAGADVDATALLRSPAFDLAEDDFFTVVVTWDAMDLLTGFFTTDLGETLEAGDGGERVVHAFAGVGGVAVHLPGEPEFVCPPSGIVGFGFCQDYCDPYPRGGDYGCGDGFTCLPFLSRDDQPVEPQGFCSEDEGGNAVGDACANDGFLGNGDCPTTDPTCGCADLNVCLGDENGENAVCAELCEPFSDVADQCGAGGCSAVPPLLGNLNLSFCVDDVEAGAAYEECEEAGFPCAADGTLCITVTQGGTPQCVPICRDGFDDCAGFEDRACEVGVFGAAVPDFMGVCL